MNASAKTTYSNPLRFKDMATAQQVSVSIYGLDIVCTMTESREGYTFKTPKGFGGRHYASFCNELGQAFDQQHPNLAIEIHKRIRGEWPESYLDQYHITQKALFA
jgi:hypothetical protein